MAILAVTISAALYLWLVQAGGRAHLRLHASVTTLRQQVAQLEQHWVELQYLRTQPLVSTSQSDLRTLVHAQVGAAGLSHALVKLDSTDANQVVVSFGAVSFADWLNWVAKMESQQVRLDTCRLESLSAPGQVSVTVTLLRARQP